MTKNQHIESHHTTKLIVSFFSIYFIWGTTYLAMKVAVESIPPFLMAATRFLVAGSILYAVLRFRGLPQPTARQWRSALIVGCLLFLGGNGLVNWAEQEIPSGIAALVVATMPLWMTLFDWLFFGGKPPTLRIMTGVILGIAGIVLLVGPAQLLAGTTELNMFYMLGLIFAPIFWSIGSLYCRRADLPGNVVMANASEMLCGGGVLLLVSVCLGELTRFQWARVELQAWVALGYLTIFGSMIALTAYAWLLKHATPAKVSTYSYVNPIIAVVLGWLILNEPISMRTALAVVVIVAGVILIVTARNTKKPEQNPAASANTTPTSTPFAYIENDRQP